MAVQVAQETEVLVRPVRLIVREFIQHIIEGEDEINNHEILEYATKRFGDDDEFKSAAARDALSVIVPEVLRNEIKNRRDEFVQTPAGASRRSKIDLTARERLASVFEGTGAGYKSFLALRKRDLLVLNERDAKTIETQKRWVAFREELAAGMNDTQTVGDSFKGADLEASWKRHFGHDHLPPSSA